jgi:hypothetical protein
MDDSVFHAAKRDEEAGGQERGGKDRIRPFGKFESATDIPAM